EVEDVTTHQMHEEWIEVPAATVEQIRATKAAGGRIIAVGTTAVRALERGGSIREFKKKKKKNSKTRLQSPSA
ncbi:hypothetical protein FM036_41735, partial [Nostoc sp. HG1]|nr:hypothetical protein [Nostoc sp. HG1]